MVSRGLRGSKGQVQIGRKDVRRDEMRWNEMRTGDVENVADEEHMALTNVISNASEG